MAKHTPNELDAQAVHVKALSRELSAHSAEYIVRACESHEDLVTACEKSLVLIKCLVTYQHDIIEEVRKIIPTVPVSTHDNPPIESIKAAIEKAGSKL